MTPHQVKEGFLSLPAKARREFVLWAVEREFSEEAVASSEIQQSRSVQAALAQGNNVGAVSVKKSPRASTIKKWRLALGVLVVLLGAIFFMVEQIQEKESPPDQAVVQELEKQQALVENEAAIAARPQSPTNLEYLSQRVQQEVILRGIPVKSEVGYLYFHEKLEKGVRIKLISGGVVVYQSTELEKWVKDQQELEIRGTLIRAKEDNLLEIPVDRQIQVKLVGKIE